MNFRASDWSRRIVCPRSLSEYSTSAAIPDFGLRLSKIFLTASVEDARKILRRLGSKSEISLRKRILRQAPRAILAILFLGSAAYKVHASDQEDGSPSSGRPVIGTPATPKPTGTDSSGAPNSKINSETQMTNQINIVQNSSAKNTDKNFWHLVVNGTTSDPSPCAASATYSMKGDNLRLLPGESLSDGNFVGDVHVTFSGLTPPDRDRCDTAEPAFNIVAEIAAGHIENGILDLVLREKGQADETAISRLDSSLRVTEVSPGRLHLSQIPRPNYMAPITGEGMLTGNAVGADDSPEYGTKAPSMPPNIPWPWKLLAPLLAALMLAGASLKFEWDTGDVLPITGSVAASFESLKEAGATGIGELGKSMGVIAGFGAAFYDGTQIYQQSVAAGDSNAETRSKLAFSVLLDGTGFILGGVIMDITLPAVGAAVLTGDPALAAMVATGGAMALVAVGKGFGIAKQFGINTISGWFAVTK